MQTRAADLLTPRILVVDDERQIHASLRLRLSQDYDLVYSFDARDALKKVQANRFDLCFADIHMPHMDGLSFIDAARNLDPELGYVVISAFDSDANLRRAIPLQVYDFISKPLPEKDAFEALIPQWVEETRRRRRSRQLAQEVGSISADRDSALLERDVEIVASETAREALLQTAGLLTTIHAHLVSAATLMGARAKSDPTATHLWRNLDEARKTADAAMCIAEGFLGSSYGDRETSPALPNEGVRHAIVIASRMARVEESNKAIDFRPLDNPPPLKGLSGIDFLLMLVPGLGAALAIAAPSSTVGIRGEYFSRLDTVVRESRWHGCLWVNRRHALTSRPGIQISITNSAKPLTRDQTEAWLKGESGPISGVTPSGLIRGVQKCHGALGISAAPQCEHFRLVLLLPT